MIAMRARTTGWMALGIEPEDKMKGADIWMCSIKDGKAVVVDSIANPIAKEKNKTLKTIVERIIGNCVEQRIELSIVYK